MPVGEATRLQTAPAGFGDRGFPVAAAPLGSNEATTRRRASAAAPGQTAEPTRPWVEPPLGDFTLDVFDYEPFHRPHESTGLVDEIR